MLRPRRLRDDRHARVHGRPVDQRLVQRLGTVLDHRRRVGCVAERRDGEAVLVDAIRADSRVARLPELQRQHGRGRERGPVDEEEIRHPARDVAVAEDDEAVVLALRRAGAGARDDRDVRLAAGRDRDDARDVDRCSRGRGLGLQLDLPGTGAVARVGEADQQCRGSLRRA